MSNVLSVAMKNLHFEFVIPYVGLDNCTATRSFTASVRTHAHKPGLDLLDLAVRRWPTASCGTHPKATSKAQHNSRRLPAVVLRSLAIFSSSQSRRADLRTVAGRLLSELFNDGANGRGQDLTHYGRKLHWVNALICR